MSIRDLLQRFLAPQESPSEDALRETLRLSQKVVYPRNENDERLTDGIIDQDLVVACVTTSDFLGDLDDLHAIKLDSDVGPSDDPLQLMCWEPAKLEGRLLEAASQIVDHEPDIVCVNEFGFPWYEDEAERDSFASRLFGAFGSPAILIAGSYHDRRDGYNRSVVVTRRNDGPTIDVVRKHNPAKFREDSTRPYHREGIRMPTTTDIRFLTAECGRFCVFICLDAYNAAHVLSAMWEAGRYDRKSRINVLAVPSFNMQRVAAFEKQCTHLSTLLNCVVVSAHGGVEAAHQIACSAGKSLKPINGGSGRIGDPSIDCGYAVFRIDRAEHATRVDENDHSMPEWLLRILGSDSERSPSRSIPLAHGD